MKKTDKRDAFMDITELVNKVQQQKKRQAQAVAAAQQARKSIERRKQFITKHGVEGKLVARF